MRNAAVARQFKNVEMSRDVRMDIGGRIFERIANAGLGTQMDDPVDQLVGERIRQRICVAEVYIEKLVCITVSRLEPRDARSLQVERIIGRKIVDSDDLLAATQQGLRDVHSDKTSRTGDQRRQISSP
jgi:hypothetical protein